MIAFRTRRRGSACIVTLITASALLALSSPSTARAASTDFLPPEQAISLLPGPTIGYSWHERDTNGLLLGAELSVAYAHLNKGFWAGFYSDVTYDFGGNSLRVSIGPELGWAFFGVDAGLMIDNITGDSPRVGFSVRPLLSFFGLATIYGRFTPGDNFATSFELGLIGKLPLLLTDDV